MSPAAVAERHVERVTTLRRSAAPWAPPRSTRGMSSDHRRIAIWHRARERVQRRALLLLLSAIDAGASVPELAHRERLMSEADRLADRIAEAEAEMAECPTDLRAASHQERAELLERGPDQPERLQVTPWWAGWWPAGGERA